MSDKKRKKKIDSIIDEINNFSERVKKNRFHKRDNPVKILVKEPKKEQKEDE